MDTKDLNEFIQQFGEELKPYAKEIANNIWNNIDNKNIIRDENDLTVIYFMLNELFITEVSYELSVGLSKRKIKYV